MIVMGLPRTKAMSGEDYGFTLKLLWNYKSIFSSQNLYVALKHNTQFILKYVGTKSVIIQLSKTSGVLFIIVSFIFSSKM